MEGKVNLLGVYDVPKERFVCTAHIPDVYDVAAVVFPFWVGLKASRKKQLRVITAENVRGFTNLFGKLVCMHGCTIAEKESDGTTQPTNG